MTGGKGSVVLRHAPDIGVTKHHPETAVAVGPGDRIPGLHPLKICGRVTIDLLGILSGMVIEIDYLTRCGHAQLPSTRRTSRSSIKAYEPMAFKLPQWDSRIRPAGYGLVWLVTA